MKMKGPNKPDALLKDEAVCDRLAISKRTLHRLRGQGLLPATRIGRAVRWRQSVVERFLYGLENEAAPGRAKS